MSIPGCVSPASTEDRRTGSERRMATNPQAKPTGEGRIVLDYVDLRLKLMLESARLPQALRPLMNPDNLVALREDLAERAEMGKTKYGTYLRTENGRSPQVDLYQELLDAVMYSGQCRMEDRDGVSGGLFELLCNLASQVAGELDKRNV